MARRTALMAVDINNTDTWTEYRAGLCDNCQAFCCRMPVEATLQDLIRMEVIDPFEAQEPLKRIARKLKRNGIIEHYNPSRAVFTLARHPSLGCIFLDPASRRCTIYEKRPQICRTHPQVGPKPGYCPYQKK